MKNSPRPNLQEVALRAGVSAMTVSRALNGNAVIAKATRLRILQICQEMGYVVVPQVSSAMRYVRTRGSGHFNGTLGFLDSFPDPEFVKKSPTYAGIVNGAISRAAELGYGMDILRTTGQSKEQLDRIIRSRGIRGIVIGMSSRPIRHLSLDWSNLAAVALGYTLRRPALHRVTSDLTRGIQLVCHHLRKLGYRRIVYVSTRNFEQRTTYLAFSGFVGWCQLYAPETLPLTFIFDPLDAAAFKKWFKQTRADCVISPPHSPARQLLEDAGTNLPNDFGFASVLMELLGAEGQGNLPGELGFATVDRESAPPSVSGLNQCQKNFGVAAVDKVVGLISTASFGIPESPTVSLLEGTWQNGTTTRKIASGEKR